MRRRLQNLLPKSEFAKNVITLMTGAGIAQVIPVFAGILLARLYSPEDFGVLSLYVSTITILGCISTWRYEVAVILPEEESKARALLLLCFYILFGMTFLYLLLLLCFDDMIVDFIEKKVHTISWRYFIILGIFLLTTNQVLNFWVNRKARYKDLAISRVLQSSSISFVNIILGLIGATGIGLILGNIAGLVLSCVYLSISIRKKDFQSFPKVTCSQILSVAKEYIYFPKFSMPSVMFDTISNIGLPILIAMFYGTKVAGLYFFSMKIVRLPINFMYSSFAQVYREKAAKLYNTNKEELLVFTKKIQVKIIKIIFPILFLLSILAPYIFNIVFGEEWKDSGDYVKYFTIFIFLNGIYSPISSIGDILMEQKAYLIFNIILALTQIGMFYLMYSTFNFKSTLFAVSLVCGIYYLLVDYYMKQRLKRQLVVQDGE